MLPTELPRVTSLLLTSLEQATSALQAFLAAWSSLEIFIGVVFKDEYAELWFQMLEDGAPQSAKPVFERFQDVMKDKYTRAYKFLIIASVLCQTEQ